MPGPVLAVLGVTHLIVSGRAVDQQDCKVDRVEVCQPAPEPVCVCVCERERERERVSVRVRVCVRIAKQIG